MNEIEIDQSNKEFDKVDKEVAEKARDKHGQKCPHCKMKLRTIDNYVGGGSHYWSLQCQICQRRYSYDSYRFELELR